MRDVFRLFAFLSRYSTRLRFSRTVIAVVIVAGVVSGLLSASFVVLINSLLAAADAVRRPPLSLFVALCVLLPILRFSSTVLLIRLAERAQLDLRLQLCRQILAAPLSHLEKLGPHRLLGTLTDDVNSLVAALAGLPYLLMNSAIIFGCLVYMGWMSLSLLGLVALFVLLGAATYRLAMMRAYRYFQLRRDHWDALVRHFRGLTDGIKELKLHRPRRDAFVTERLSEAAEGRMRYSVKANSIYAAASSWSQVMSLALLGLFLFASPSLGITESHILSGYVLAVLFMLTPLEIVLNSLPSISTASVALARIDQLGLSLMEVPPEAQEALPATASLALRDGIELNGVTHTFQRDDGELPFTLGPIDLSIKPGQLTFLVGGNGSGKTTLAKLITGLYSPEQGWVAIDGQRIHEQDHERLRAYFSVVFADSYLFDSLLGLRRESLDQEAAVLLTRLHLERKLRVEDGRLSTLDLSQGQRKRLALLTAYLEDRPIYLFDEWAADQDPVFRELFYRQLLPELKARGKTLIVISHDDRYYGLGDRVIKLAEGKVESDVEREAAERLETVTA